MRYASIYDALGEQLSEEAEAAMRAHVGVAAQNRFGKHQYDWKNLGLPGNQSTSDSANTAPISPSTSSDRRPHGEETNPEEDA